MTTDLSIECFQPLISWTRANEQSIIPQPGKLHISKGGQRLEIPRLRTEDAGEYHCVAQNEVGLASDMVSVDILGTDRLKNIDDSIDQHSVPPSISRDTIELNPRLPLGRTLTLFCDAIGKPNPQISWSKNGSPLNADRPRIVFGDGNKFVQIENISLADRGVHRCEATNRAGNDSVEYRVDVFQVRWGYGIVNRILPYCISHLK